MPRIDHRRPTQLFFGSAPLCCRGSAAAVLLPQCFHDNDAILLPRCLHRATSTELIPPSCFHQAASTALLLPLSSSCRRAGVSTDDAALPVLLMQPACHTARTSLIRQQGVRSEEQKKHEKKKTTAIKEQSSENKKTGKEGHERRNRISRRAKLED